jgi:hypothetical protein
MIISFEGGLCAQERAGGPGMQVEREQLLEKLLSDNLARTIAWVSFAEAKNLALLTFCSGWMAALFVYAASDDTPWSLIKLGCGAALLPFFVGAAISLYSFLPQTSPNSLRKNGEAELDTNFLFYGNLDSLDPQSTGVAFEAKYLSADGKLSSEFMKDIGTQIVINSRIAVQKFRLFHWASAAVVAAFAVLLVFAITMFVYRIY